MRFRGIEVGDALAIQRPRRRPCDLSTPTAGLRLVVATARLRLEVPGQAPAPRSVPQPVPQMGLRSCGGHMPPRVPGGPAPPKLAGWVCWRPCAPCLAGESARRTCLPRPARRACRVYVHAAPGQRRHARLQGTPTGSPTPNAPQRERAEVPSLQLETSFGHSPPSCAISVRFRVSACARDRRTRRADPRVARLRRVRLVRHATPRCAEPVKIPAPG